MSLMSAQLAIAVAVVVTLTGCSEFTAVTQPSSSEFVGTWTVEGDTTMSFEVEADGDVQFGAMPEEIRLRDGESLEGRTGTWEIDEGIPGQPASFEVRFVPDDVIGLVFFTKWGEPQLLHIIGDFDSRDYIAFVRE